MGNVGLNIVSENIVETVDTVKIDEFIGKQAANIILAVIILVLGWLLIKFVMGLVKKRLKKRNVKENIIRIISAVIKTVLYTFLFFTAITVSGVPISVVATVFSAIIVAVAVSVKDSLALFSDGIIITVSRLFDEGDLIEIPGQNILGYVVKMRILHTILRTKDNREVIIPNDIIAKNTVVNYTKYGVKRIDIDIEVSYDSDIELAKKVIYETVKNEPTVRNDFKEPFIIVKDLNNNAVDILCRVYANWDYYDETDYILHDKIRTALSANGIEIPFAQIDVHMK